MLEGVTWFRQAAFRWQGEGPVVYVDPWGINDDVPADVIMITHAHEDHLQPHQIEKLRKPDTKVVATRDVATTDCCNWLNCMVIWISGSITRAM